MRNILTIIKKELRRVFLDRKLIMSIVVLPGVLMFAIFLLMGFVTDAQNENNAAVVVDALVFNLDEENPLDKEFLDNLYTLNVNVTILYELTSEQYIQMRTDVENGDLNFFIIFSDNFFQNILDMPDQHFEIPPQGIEPPSVRLYFNSLNESSQMAFDRTIMLLSTIREVIVDYQVGPIFIIGAENLFEERNLMATIFASIFPMMIIISIVSAIISITPEMVAGEKERGSLPILLVTATKRNHIAIAKVLGASLITMASVVSMLIGTIFGFQFFLNSVAEDVGLQNVYGLTDYLLMLSIFIVTTLSLTGLFSLISAFARNTKEAMSYSSALMMFAMVIPLLGGFINFPGALWVYLIPVLNTTITITDIFMLEANTVGILLTIGSNLLFTIGIAFALTRMFESEKIMFNK